MYSGIIRLHSARLKPVSFSDLHMGQRFLIESKECFKLDDTRALECFCEDYEDRVMWRLKVHEIVQVHNYKHIKILIKGFRT